jgi:hypothetical protein
MLWDQDDNLDFYAIAEVVTAMLFDMLELMMEERSKLITYVLESVNDEIHVHCMKNTS